MLYLIQQQPKIKKNTFFKYFFSICPILLFSKDIFYTWKLHWNQNFNHVSISSYIIFFHFISYLFKRFYEIFINWIFYIPEYILKCNRKDLLKNHIDSGYNWIKNGRLCYFLFTNRKKKVFYFRKITSLSFFVNLTNKIVREKHVLHVKLLDQRSL